MQGPKDIELITRLKACALGRVPLHAPKAAKRPASLWQRAAELLAELRFLRRPLRREA